MASNSVRKPLLSQRIDLNRQTRSKDTPRRKIFRRSKSAPLAIFFPLEKNGIGSSPQPHAIFGNIHPNIFKVFVFLAFYLSAATICFYVVRNQITGKKTDGVLDALYFCIVTMTTVGYGDLVPSSDAAKLLACACVCRNGSRLFDTQQSGRLFAQFFLYIAELHTENGQRELVEWVLTRKVTNVDLEVADLDDDGSVDAAEFVLHKLKEMGKISQDDISVVMKEFDDLDVDQSGTLSPSDIILAQSSQY